MRSLRPWERHCLASLLCLSVQGARCLALTKRLGHRGHHPLDIFHRHLHLAQHVVACSHCRRQPPAQRQDDSENAVTTRSVKCPPLTVVLRIWKRLGWWPRCSPPTGLQLLPPSPPTLSVVLRTLYNRWLVILTSISHPFAHLDGSSIGQDSIADRSIREIQPPFVFHPNGAQLLPRHVGGQTLQVRFCSCPPHRCLKLSDVGRTRWQQRRARRCGA